VIRFAVEFGSEAAPIFAQHNWMWKIDLPHVPSADEITEALLVLMDTLDAQPATVTHTSTGRIRVERLGEDWTVSLEALTTTIDLPEYIPVSDPVLHTQGKA
jgi:hypothetical protein